MLARACTVTRPSKHNVSLDPALAVVIGLDFDRDLTAIWSDSGDNLTEIQLRFDRRVANSDLQWVQAPAGLLFPLLRRCGQRIVYSIYCAIMRDRAIAMGHALMRCAGDQFYIILYLVRYKGAL